MSGAGAAPVVSGQARTELVRCARRCREASEGLYDGVVQELTALSLSLGASAESEQLRDQERRLLATRARAIEQCSRLLCAVAERLEDVASAASGEDGPAPAPPTLASPPPPDGTTEGAASGW
ncbi:MAG: hypothetical protein ACLQT7_10010 [Candidatus Dormibacteria bacterium]